jgi:hypothetical protein
LKASVVWLRGGKLIAGSKEQPFLNKINIELYGNFEDPYLLIDPFIEASNKVLAVTSVSFTCDLISIKVIRAIRIRSKKGLD